MVEFFMSRMIYQTRPADVIVAVELYKKVFS